MSESWNITILLQRVRTGDKSAEAALVSLLYHDLKSLARAQLRGERANHTLQATDLVNELYLRLAGSSGIDCENRTHFLAIAARNIRQILVEHARRRNRLKRGGDQDTILLQEGMAITEQRCPELLALDEAMARLGRQDARMCAIVEMRVFGGLKIEEIAPVLNVSPRTVKSDWRIACAWLRSELEAVDPCEDRQLGTS